MKRRTFPAGKSGKPPYSKYHKHPYKYSAAYYEWRRRVLSNTAEYAKLELQDHT